MGISIKRNIFVKLNLKNSMIMDENSLKRQIARKIKIIMVAEGKSQEEVFNTFAVEGDLQETYNKLFDYIQNKGYKESRERKNKQNQIENKDLKEIGNLLFMEGKTDKEIVSELKKIYYKPQIEKLEKEIEQLEKELLLKKAKLEKLKDY